MSVVDGIIAAFVLFLGVGLIFLMGSFIFFPLYSMVTRSIRDKRLSLLESSLTEVDDLIEAEQWDDAILILERGLRMEFPSSPHIVAAIRDYQHGVLSRTLVIAEARGIQPRVLPAVERCIFQLADVSVQYLKACGSLLRLEKRQELAGVTHSNWSLKESEARIAELKTEVERKQRELRSAFEQLFASLREAPGDAIVYH